MLHEKRSSQRADGRRRRRRRRFRRRRVRRVGRFQRDRDSKQRLVEGEVVGVDRTVEHHGDDLEGSARIKGFASFRRKPFGRKTFCRHDV
jgi:hypothetical protein